MKIISILILSLIVFQTNPTIWDLLTDNNKVEIFKEIEKQQKINNCMRITLKKI